MTDKIGGAPGRLNTNQVKGPILKPKVTLSGGFDKLNLNQLGPSQNADGVRTGRQVGITPPEGETSSEDAAEGASLMRSLIQPGEGGRLTFDLTSNGLTNFANSQSGMFAELDGYKVVDNLNVGEDSISPEKREELRRLSQQFEARLSNLGDEKKQELLQSLASDMNTAIDSTFEKNNITVNASGMERFFKFDPDVKPEENFLAKLGGYISAMRGETPDGAFGPRVTQLLDKFINLTGDLSANMAGSDGLAKAKMHSTITGSKTGGSPGAGGGGTPPAGMF